MSGLPDDRDPAEGLLLNSIIFFSSKKKNNFLGEDERDPKRKLFSTKTSASKEKSSTLLINNETNEESLTTAQDFKSLLRPKKKNGFKLIKTKTKIPSEQKEQQSSLKDEKRKSKANRDNVASTAG
ncbi:unnamed protein product [Rotaria sp. Silwood2]|nr:unnamed protein product [Rotaria sp. Silwood2]